MINRKSLRFKILQFITHTIFRTPEFIKPNKFCIVLRWILFPFKSIKYYILNEFYDPERNIYTIEGLKISAELFAAIANKKNVGEVFQIIENKNNIPTLRRFDPYQLHIIPIQISRTPEEMEIIKKQWFDIVSKGISLPSVLSEKSNEQH